MPFLFSLEMAGALMGDTAKLPVPGRRNILITSALPYVNNVPHLGNIIGCVLSADVFARFCRLRGYNVVYICGTDEYGTATETKALEEKCSPQEICDKYHSIHNEVYKWFHISFDKFGRTSTPQHTEICQAIFQRLLENDCLSENTIQQLFCEVCQRFLADRLVEGKCPTLGCNYESARGDQCEKCGKLLNPTELVDPKCKVCGSTPHLRDTKHLFLELSLLRERLEEYIGTMSDTGSWSQNAIQATRAWLKEGLKARCITRDLKWGVPVPHEKFKDKVFYVWFDAPIGYISITSCYTPQWEKWWKDPENVELYQFMGKDNVPFHTVMFPSTLLGTGEKWTMMKTISATEYLNYESGKFSKSKGVGIFGNDVKDTNIPAEVWRYYLLTSRPEVSDTLFTWTDLQSKLNNELLNNVGNFTNRVLTFIAKPTGSGYNSIVPDASDPESHLLTKTFAVKVSKYVEQYVEAMEKVKLKLGLKIAMSLSNEGNAYLQESEFWKLFKKDLVSCSIVMRASVGVVYLLASIMEPFMPPFSTEVLKQLNLEPGRYLSFDAEEGNVDWARPWDFLPSGHRIGKPEPLFIELKDEAVEYLRGKFSGSQAARGNEVKQQETPTCNNDAKSKAVDTDMFISRLDFRVGTIKKAWKHPNADSLYVEEIDVGEESNRTAVSGLVNHVPMEQMQVGLSSYFGAFFLSKSTNIVHIPCYLALVIVIASQDRKVCVLCNLKPVNMRGVKSHAMVLAAFNYDRSKVELVDPPALAVVGEQVTFPGFPGKPDTLINPKSKLWEKVQTYLHTNSDLVACYMSVPFTTSAGVCKVSSISNGDIM
ncbi:putative methionine--tRNA ligase [Dioscorea sansibarensis]